MVDSRAILRGNASGRWTTLVLLGSLSLLVLGFWYGRHFDPTSPGRTTTLLVFTIPLTGVEIVLLLGVAVLMAIVARTTGPLLLAMTSTSTLPIGFGLGLLHPTYTAPDDPSVVPIVVAFTLSLLAGAVGYFLGHVGTDGSN